MILYKIGDVENKIDYDTFLCLIHKGEKMYKSSFTSFAELYEFLDKNINHIDELIFNDLHLYLEDGVLHNLYGPAVIQHLDPKTNPINSDIRRRYLINGKFLFSQDYKKIINRKEEFEGPVCFIDIIKKHKPSERQKEGEHYIKTNIDLEHLRKIDKRKRKLKRIIK